MNGNQRRVILYGNSLILEGVRANLAALPGLEVLDQPLDVPLDPDQTKGPTTVIFDLEAIQPEFLLALLQQPGLQLIGIDPETHQAQVWSGRQVQAVVSTDLIRIIQETEPIIIRSKGDKNEHPNHPQ
jgi:hypothetical protein